MNNKSIDLLTKGLITGYGGGKITDVIRGGIPGKVSHVDFPDGSVYHDEWFVPSHNGGGQELIKAGDQMYTRLFGGGSPAPEKLQSLGISEQDINKYLISKIIELKDKTRLFQSCKQKQDGDWHYTYTIANTYKELQIVTAIESITYKGHTVHIHAFILCPLL